MEYILDTNILLSLNYDIIQPRIGVTYKTLYTVRNEIKQDKIINSSKYKMINNFLNINTIVPIGILNEECGNDSKINELKVISPKKYIFITFDDELQKKVSELGFTVYSRQEFINIINIKKIIKQPFFIFLKNYYKTLLQGIIIPIIFTIGITVSSIIVYLYPYFINVEWFQKTMLLLVFIISYLLYLFKIKRQVYYGLTEILLGVITIFITIFHFNESVSDILKILGGFYIIIRGLNNIDAGIISPVIKKRWQKIFFINTIK